MFTIFHTSTESFIGSKTDFQILTITEKCSLYQNNILLSIYGYDIFQQTKRIIKQLNYDLIIIKLILLIFTFPSNCYMVDKHKNMYDDSLLYGTFRLLSSQNLYVEILWKYIIY